MAAIFVSLSPREVQLGEDCRLSLRYSVFMKGILIAACCGRAMSSVPEEEEEAAAYHPSTTSSSAPWKRKPQTYVRRTLISRCGIWLKASKLRRSD